MFTEYQMSRVPHQVLKYVQYLYVYCEYRYIFRVRSTWMYFRKMICINHSLPEGWTIRQGREHIERESNPSAKAVACPWPSTSINKITQHDGPLPAGLLFSLSHASSHASTFPFCIGLCLCHCLHLPIPAHYLSLLRHCLCHYSRLRFRYF
jgi:hypothetical protein